MRRVSNPMLFVGMMTDMHNNLARLMKMNKQGSTGKLNHKPSDNPIDVTRELGLSTTIFENEQYIRNMKDGLTWLKNTDTALDQIGGQIDRVRELAVYAGDGALGDAEMEAIAQELIQIQEGIRQAANYSVEGRYLLSGAATSVPPFQRDKEGHVVYMGNDYRVQYEMDRGIVSDVSLTGREVFPKDYVQYNLRSTSLPTGFRWTGRNEIFQIKVGDRSVKFRIPEEDWVDNRYDSTEAADYNRFRDPGELTGLDLDKIAEIIENSVNMGDTGKLISVQVIKDDVTETQQLEIRSHTGEPIFLTSWAETDGMPMSQAVESVNSVNDTGAGFKLAAAGALSVKIGDNPNALNINFTAGMTLKDMAKEISKQDGLVGKIIDGGTDHAKLVVISAKAGEKLIVNPSDGAGELFGDHPLASVPVTQSPDHSHIGLASMLGIDTSLQGTEFPVGTDLATGLSNDNRVYWRIQAGKHHAEVLVNAGPDMTMEDLAQEIRAVAGDWLEAVVQTDPGDKVSGPDLSGENKEDGTQRLILRSKDGTPVNVLDMAPADGNDNTTLAQTMGISTAVYAKSGGTFPTGDALDPYMPARMTVSVGVRDYDVKLYGADVLGADGKVDAMKMALQIQRQVGKAPDGQDLIQVVDLASPGATDPQVALFSSTGEPLRIVDRNFGDPSVDEYSGGLALQSGIASGIQGSQVAPDVQATGGGKIRIQTVDRMVDISVAPGETMMEISEKIRKYAGRWLNVAYVDTDLDSATNQVQLSLTAKDGSPLSIFDLEPANMSSGGPGAAKAFGISTGIMGPALEDTTDIDITANRTMTIEVDGFSHTMDLRVLDKDGDGHLKFNADPALDELGYLDDLINSRFQGQDVRAQFYTDGDGKKHLMLDSPKGYKATVQGGPTATVLGAASASTTVRGGASPYGQNVPRRTGADYRESDFFGLMEDLIDGVKGQDRAAVTSLLGDIDNQINSLLRRRTEEGALVNRYDNSVARLTQNNGNYTDLYGSISDTDLADLAMKYMQSQAIYQAGLATIARIIQPTLVDFLK